MTQFIQCSCSSCCAVETPPHFIAAMPSHDRQPVCQSIRSEKAVLSTKPKRQNYSRRSGGRLVDFKAVNQAALDRWHDVLARLFPRGEAHDNEMLVGSLHGEAGRSLKIRLRGDRKGVWCDFATGEKGGDPVSLVAAANGVSQIEGARRLAILLGLDNVRHD